PVGEDSLWDEQVAIDGIIQVVTVAPLFVGTSLKARPLTALLGFTKYMYSKPLEHLLGVKLDRGYD
ncbi:hypothetical protein HDU82_008394, partial [Entophlyctis luteolus]